MASSSGLVVMKIDDVGDRCELWRLRCPVRDIEELRTVSTSKYSPEFTVAGVPWRLHFQQRVEPQSGVPHLAVHLQYLGANPKGAFAHFMLTLCNQSSEGVKQKTFHCHFKKSGSAWGLHHFIPLEKVLNPVLGFVDSSTGTPSLVVDVVVRVLEPEADGTFTLGALPQAAGVGTLGGVNSSTSNMAQFGARNASMTAAAPARHAGGTSATAVVPPVGSAFGSQTQPTAPRSTPLQYPYDEVLCDMSFSLQGQVLLKAHRCVIAVRCPALAPQVDGKPLPRDSVVEVAAVAEVFRCFLRFVYTEEPPERGALRPEHMVDLYLLAVEQGLITLAEQCLGHVTQLLTPENLLPIIATRFDQNDDTLNAVYLRALVAMYDRIIEDPHFEALPGPLNRRLSLILRGKEPAPQVQFPPGRAVSLSTHLGMLAESGAFADYDLCESEGAPVRAHAFILASRSTLFKDAFYKRNAGAALPSLDTDEFAFSRTAWTRFVAALYRDTLEHTRDITAEDVALVWKLNDALVLNGALRKETEVFLVPDAAIRLLVYAEKHGVPKLKEAALRMAASSFRDSMRRDTTLWDVVGELSQPALLALFRATMSQEEPSHMGSTSGGFPPRRGF